MLINRHLAHRLVVFRLLLILCFMLGLISLILFRLFYLQIIEKQHYTTLSLKNLIEIQPLPPTRGLILDRNGVILAKNIPVSSLEIIPAKVHGLKKTIRGLRKIIPITPTEVRQFYRQVNQHRDSDSVPLKIKLTENDAARFFVQRYHFPGVIITHRLLRYYPKGDINAHTVGYVGRINARELNKLNTADYRASNYIGKVGIERYYESLLHGHIGYEHIEINAQGRTIKVLKKVPTVPGKNIYLTIDSTLEEAAQKALKGINGAVVAIDPSSGEVLALASNPSYNPNLFVKGLSITHYNTLKNSPDKPLYNRALRGLYPPASTIKPFIGLEGLSSNTIDLKDKIKDIGWYKLPHSRHRYHDWNPYGHGVVNLHRAIVVSCDTYFYILSHLLKINPIHDFLTKFGLGQATNIDMNEELAGIVPSPSWKEHKHGTHWYPGDTIITGIGQGFLLTTPLQLAQATSILAMHGKHYRPHLLLATQIPGQAPEFKQTKPNNAVLLSKPKYWNDIITAMQDVIRSGEGTGFRFGHPAYTVALKTGTAQVYSADRYQKSKAKLPLNLRDHSLVIAFAPVKNPKIAIAIIAEHNKNAPLIARKIIDAYLSPRQKKHQEPHASPSDQT
jgi:penicillin-binding protein 2